MAFNITSNVLSMLNTVANMKTANETKKRNEQAKTQAEAAEATAKSEAEASRKKAEELSNLQTNQLQAIAGNTSISAGKDALETLDKANELTKATLQPEVDKLNELDKIHKASGAAAQEASKLYDDAKNDPEVDFDTLRSWGNEAFEKGHQHFTDFNAYLDQRDKFDTAVSARKEALDKLESNLINKLQQNKSTKELFDMLMKDKQGGNR